MKCGIVVFPGSNCDHDCYHILKHVLQLDTHWIWHKDEVLNSFDFIVLPGGLGTLDELYEMLTWSQLGLHAKPCGLLNQDGFYDPLLAWLERGTREGFIKPRHLEMLLVESDPAALLERVVGWSAPGK